MKRGNFKQKKKKTKNLELGRASLKVQEEVERNSSNRRFAT